MDLLQNPVRIHIVSNNVIKTTYLFVGDVPSDIYAEIKKKPVKSHKLESYYGKSWKQKLGFDNNSSSSKKKGSYEGGVDELPDGSLMDDIKVDVSDLENPEAINSDINLFEPTSGDNSSHSSIEVQETQEQLSMTKKESQSKTPEVAKVPKETERGDLEDDEVVDIETIDIFGNAHTKDPSGTGQVIISKMMIYPEDRISEFKEKIYIETGIIPCKQHIYYTSQKMAYPMSYQINADSRIVVDIREIKDQEGDNIEGLPIDPYLYKYRDNIRVLAFDHFKTVGQLYSKHQQLDYYLVDLDDYIKPIRAKLAEIIKDKFQMDMLYYGFIIKYWPMITIESFSDFFTSELADKYPDLVPDREVLKRKYDVEQKTIDSLYSTPPSNMHKMSITSAILNVDVNRHGYKTKLNIRNIFDRFVLDLVVHHIKVLLYHNGKAFILNKSYNGMSHKYKLTHINSMLLFISTSMANEDDFSKYVILQIYDNGKYQIRTTWGEELEMDFEKIHQIVRKYIDPVIDQINEMGMYVFSNTIRLRKPEKHLIQYTGLNMNIYWRRMIIPSDFRIIREATVPLVQAGILQARPSNMAGMIEFHFTKGITEYDIRNLERTHDMKNYYSYLTDSKIKQRWEYLFRKGRLMKITHRTSDVKIEVQGVREKEFDVVYDYITRMMMGIDSKFSKPSSERAVKKKLNALKEMDPEAYDFRRNDNAMVYSRLCQHKDQPVMYSKEEFQKMKSTQKDKLFEYWNFTRNEKAYFACPDVKKPYISFIVNKHPKDFCLICCKITPSDPDIVKNKNIKKTQIYNACKEDHYYSGNKIIRQKSKYIMTYGKDIDTGRISHLPDETISPLFKDTIYDYSLNKEDPNINFELCNTKAYYIYGTHQTIGMISYTGGVVSIAHAMNMPYTDLVGMCISHLKQFGFEILLDGELPDHFTNVKELMEVMKNLFIDTSPKVVVHPFNKWNELFIDMVKLYLQTTVLMFEDIGYNNIDFIIPPNIKRADEMISPQHKFILLLKKGGYYYPIYIIEPEKFFKDESIERRIFEYKDGAITKIVNMVSYSLDKEEKIHSSIDLNIIQDFVEGSEKKDRKYKFYKQFINTRNLIYGAILSCGKSFIYVPVDFSYYSMTKVPLEYTFIRKDYDLKRGALDQFIEDYNKFILDISVKRNLFTSEYMESSESQKKKMKPQQRVIPFYPFINPEKIVEIGNKSIGFISGGMTFYHNPEKPTSSEAIKLNYDPDYVNTIISTYRENDSVNDKRLEKLGKSLYEHNIYQITVMEFMKAFNQQKNTKIRKALVDLIKKTNFKSSLTHFIREFNEILADYPSDAGYIRAQINEFYNVHLDKSILLEHISGTYYDFDRVDLGDDPRKELKRIASKFTKIGEPKVGNFPNIMVPCEDSDASYCVNQKLVIPAKKLDEIIDIFADIIKNKYFETYIGYVAFMNNTRDYFNFEKHTGEDIDIQPYTI